MAQLYKMDRHVLGHLDSNEFRIDTRVTTREIKKDYFNMIDSNLSLFYCSDLRVNYHKIASNSVQRAYNDYGKKTMVINKLIIDSAILLFVYVIVLFLFQYQSIYLYFLENRKMISLNCLLGKNIWQKYRDFIIVNLFVYLVLLLWMVLIVKNISTIGLYLWIFTILIDFMIALIFRTYFERKKVLLSLKGDLE